MQTEQLLCWSGMTDTEHTTSGKRSSRTTFFDINCENKLLYRVIFPACESDNNIKFTEPPRIKIKKLHLCRWRHFKDMLPKTGWNIWAWRTTTYGENNSK